MVVLPLNSGRYISLMELLVSGYIPLVRLAFGKPSVFDYRMPRVQCGCPEAWVVTAGLFFHQNFLMRHPIQLYRGSQIRSQQ